MTNKKLIIAVLVLSAIVIIETWINAVLVGRLREELAANKKLIRCHLYNEISYCKDLAMVPSRTSFKAVKNAK